MIGPFTEPPFHPWAQNMMKRPKKNSNERRIIVDLTWLHGNSVNSGIQKGYYQGKQSACALPNIMDAARIGPGAYLWSGNLARADC